MSRAPNPKNQVKAGKQKQGQANNHPDHPVSQSSHESSSDSGSFPPLLETTRGRRQSETDLLTAIREHPVDTSHIGYRPTAGRLSRLEGKLSLSPAECSSTGTRIPQPLSHQFWPGGAPQPSARRATKTDPQPRMLWAHTSEGPSTIIQSPSQEHRPLNPQLPAVSMTNFKMPTFHGAPDKMLRNSLSSSTTT